MIMIMFILRPKIEVASLLTTITIIITKDNM